MHVLTLRGAIFVILQVCADDIRALSDMFSNVNVNTIRSMKVTQGMSSVEIVDCLLEKEPHSLCTILDAHARSVMGRDELYITVNRACIWNKAKSVYKGAVHDESILHKYVTIEFCGEEGVDAGALRNDFFEETLRQANDAYFEGQDEEESQNATGEQRQSWRWLGA